MTKSLKNNAQSATIKRCYTRTSIAYETILCACGANNFITRKIVLYAMIWGNMEYEYSSQWKVGSVQCEELGVEFFNSEC